MKFSQFVRRAEARPPALVLQSSFANALGIIRNLGREGIPVLALDPSPAALGFRSRFAYGLLCPNPKHDEEAFIAFLEDLGRQLPQPGVIFPTHDEYIWPVSRHADRLSRWYRIPFSPWETMQRLYDKEEQLRAAWRVGVDTPQTAFVTGITDLPAAVEQIPFPAILKPVESLAFKTRFRRPILEVPTPADAESAFARAADCGTLMLQEVVPGDDSELFTLGAAVDAQSRPLAMFTGRKLRQHPRTFGTARFAESVWVPEIADAGLRLLQELHFYGVSQVEFKRDPRDGRFKLMEVNARHWLWHSLAAACGVNLTLASYADAVGLPFIAPQQIEGRKWVLLTKDVFDSAREIRRGELGLFPWLRTLHNTRADGLMALDDPLPGLVSVGRIVSRTARRRAVPTERNGREPLEEQQL